MNVKETNILAKSTHRWKAHNVAKQLKGMVKHELLDGKETPFEPRVEYDARFEPYPWVVR